MANLQAGPYQRGRGPQKDDRREEKGRGRPVPAREFRNEDRDTIARSYRGPRNLPPGLSGRVKRGDRLPAGWAKRFRPFPAALERQLPPPCAGCARGFIDGYAVVYDRRTHVVFDVFVAFGR